MSAAFTRIEARLVGARPALLPDKEADPLAGRVGIGIEEADDIEALTGDPLRDQPSRDLFTLAAAVARRCRSHARRDQRRNTNQRGVLKRTIRL